MKHPALTRVLAVVLAVVSVLTLISGGVSIAKAVKDQKEALRQEELLADRAYTAAYLLGCVEGSQIVYDNTLAALPETQADYEKDSSDYRTELATYTATRAGLVMGRNAMGAAAGAMQSAWEQYNAGLAAYEEGASAFEEGYAQYLAAKDGLAQGWAAYYEGMAQLDANADEIESTRLQVEMLLPLVEKSRQAVSDLKEVIAALEAEQSEDEAALEEKRQELETLLNQFDPMLSEYETQMLAYRAALLLYGQAETLLNEQIAQGVPEDDARNAADQFCQEAFGMSFAELKTWLVENEPEESSEEMEETKLRIELTQEEYERLLTLCQEDQELMDAAKVALDEAEEQLAEREQQLRDALAAIDAPAEQLTALKEKLEEGQAQLDANEPAILEGKAQLDSAKDQLDAARTVLEAGQQGVNAGWGQLNEKEKELEEEVGVLREERDELLATYRSISDMQQIIDDHETLESRFRSARTTLLSYDGVARRYGEGEGLIESAQAELNAQRREHSREFAARCLICALMIFSALFALLAMLGAFEKLHVKRLWLPVLLAVLFAAAGEAGSLLLGRGLWFTAIFVVVFGLVLLPFSLMRTKKA